MDLHAAAPSAATRPSALDAPTLCHAFQTTAAERPGEVALRNPGDQIAITWREYAERVEAIGAGLARLGVERGDSVALMVLNRPEFHLVDTAVLHLGATPFSVYNTATPEQVAHQLRNSRCKVVVTERHFLRTVQTARRHAPQVEHLVQIDGADDDIVSLAELEGTGLSSFRFAETWQAVTPDDLAALIYTSGTTGPPKGVELTHRNAMAECAACAERFPLTPGGRTMSYLPSAHVVDRWSNHWWLSLTCGFNVTSVGDLRTVLFLLPGVRPTRWVAVPRIWEKLHAAIVGQGVSDPEKLSEDERAALRARIGLDEAEHLGGGAAPMPIDVLRYFEALGMPISEGWGMSETAGVATGDPRASYRLGTCGRPLPGLEIDVAADGELLIRGPTIMRGYRDNPGATAEAFAADGWLRTGDIAHTEDRYVSIIDRKKELIITAGGKNISPANVESRIEAGSLLIAHAAAVGDRRPYVAALIALDPDACVDFAAEHGIDDASVAALATHPEVRSIVHAAVEAANAGLSRAERVKRFEILPVEWLPGGEELTPTMKLKRRAISTRYAAEIDELYSSKSARFSPGHEPVR
jgi:long-subunit acyl-CoA synthetase (AMP-forming)